MGRGCKLRRAARLVLSSVSGTRRFGVFPDPMRRLLSSLLLAFIIVGAQQSALVHEIGHGFGQDSASTAVAVVGEQASGGDKSGTGAYCQKCFQFAHVTGAITGHPPTLLWHRAKAEPAKANSVAAIAADAPLSRSRGPPFVL